ncbi:WXG100 family type VII secretion target [Streptomyces zhihengii]|uniref:ESAT-6-like protein n=1 Tax=Streptomyces zhihengii TaxID=1818004 RepID=A0ABS2V3V3_9ACTN|nr:WXG100 family type VII secretion target [Streptomyces zhihengii]MBM9624499.1 WXG100 family type VII secretion target [Streptomyces zhihengii]
MPYGDDGIVHVNYGSVGEAVTSMQQITTAIRQRLAQLETGLQPLVNSWEGQDREAYYVKQREWNAAAEKLNAILASHGGLLDDIGASYDLNERKLRQGWENVQIG